MDFDTILQRLRMNKFITLNFSAQCLGNDLLKCLANTLVKNKSLRLLMLNETKIGTDGIKALAKALIDNRGLQELDLSLNEIEDEGLLALASMLRKNRTLRFLYLCWNNFGKSIDVLAESIRLNPIIQQIRTYTRYRPPLLLKYLQRNNNELWWPLVYKHISNVFFCLYPIFSRNVYAYLFIIDQYEWYFILNRYRKVQVLQALIDSVLKE